MSDPHDENRRSSYFAFPSPCRSFWRHFLLVLLVTEAWSECFYPDGTPRLDAQPCKPTQNQSFCCLFGWACLENRICRTTTSVADWNVRSLYALGSCTDSAWESDQCPHFCFGMYLLSSYANPSYPSCYRQSYFLRLHAIINESEAGRSAGVGILQCPDKNTYCCDREACDCNNGTGTITLQGSTSAFTVIGIFQSSTTSESKTLSSSLTPSSTILSATSPRLRSSLSSSSAPLFPSTSTLPVSANPAASDSQQPLLSPLSTKLGIGIGVSIGTPLVVALVSLVARRERRLQTELQQLRNSLLPINNNPHRLFPKELEGDGRTTHLVKLQDPTVELPTNSRTTCLAETQDPIVELPTSSMS